MSLKSPSVGSKGLWSLAEPFNNYLPINTALECTAISNYGQLQAIGINAYETYYKPFELSLEVYQEHLENSGRIVFLKTDAGKRYAFPLHYLLTYPIGTGVQYISYGIGIRLGALPLDTNVDKLINQLKDLIKKEVGVENTIESMALSEIQIVENAQHARIEEARKALMEENKSNLDTITTLASEVSVLKTKLGIAEDEVIRLSKLNNELRTLLGR